MLAASGPTDGVARSEGCGATSEGCLMSIRTPVRVALVRVPEMAREMTGARYAALAVLNGQRDGLEHFWTAGVDEDTRRAIGHLPRGRGVLGDLILRPRPLRVADVSRHPNCYGFPSGHPVMRAFSACRS